MISNKCTYALKAMLELACREGRGPATITDIAAAQQVPGRFLEAILRELKQGGLTESVRGKHGGYTLARPAREITVGDVIRLLEGPLFEADSPEAPADRAFAPLWQSAESALNAVYDATHFEALAERYRQQTMQFVPDYAI